MKRFVLGVFLSIFATSGAIAASPELRVLIDTDNDAATGCGGFEQVLITSVDASKITTAAVAICTAGAFATPVPLSGSWASSDALVETYVPIAQLGATAPQIRLSFMSGSQTLGTALWPPSLDPKRRHATGPGAQPQLITLDGDGKDWGTIEPLAPSLYAFADTTTLWFRFDGKLNTPTATDDTYNVRQGKTLNVNAPGVLTNDSNPDPSTTLTAAATSNPQHGTLALDPTGAFVYTNDGANAPVDSFKYKASNGGATSNEATATINVTLDKKPIAVADAYSVPHAGTLTVPIANGVLLNDSDPDHDRLTAVLGSGPQHGTLSLNADGSFTYTHDGSNTVQDTFTYRADDGVLLSSPAVVTITIGPDAAPAAQNDAYGVAEGGTLVVAGGERQRYRYAGRPMDGADRHASGARYSDPECERRLHLRSRWQRDHE